MRFSMYALCSTATCGWLAWQAYQQRRQFYPTVIHLTTSKVSVLALGNEALVLTLLFGKLCKRIFFGRLREAEVEHLYERSWYAITETCLAMTIFREEFNFRFVTLFTALLFLKIFHWLMQDRISYMEQTPAVPFTTHARMLLLMASLFAFDGAFLYHAISISIQRGPSVLILFAFEHLILASTVCATFSKYALHINDLRLAGRWDSKGVYMFYLELMTDLFQMIVYLAFFFLICTYYGLPLHILRDLYLTVRSFRSRVADFVRYRRVTHNMHERFPDASEEDLERFDRTCIICREHLSSAKKLACGHMFHFHCLRSWLERQQTCPTCRATIAPAEATPAAAAEANTQDVAGMQAAAAAPMMPVAEPWIPADMGPGMPWHGRPMGAAAGGLPDAAGAHAAAGLAGHAFGGLPPAGGLPGVNLPGAGLPGVGGGFQSTNGTPVAGVQMPFMGMPGIPTMGMPGIPTMGMPGIPTMGIPGMSSMGMPGMASMGVPGVPFMGMPGMASMGMPGMSSMGMPANLAGALPHEFAHLFSPAVVLPSRIQPAVGESFTTANFIQQQIEWLQEQLTVLQSAMRPGAGEAVTPVGAPFSHGPVPPTMASCAGCCSCSSGGMPDSAPSTCTPNDPSQTASNTRGTAVEAPSTEAQIHQHEEPRSPTVEEKDELRRRRVERLSSASVD